MPFTLSHPAAVLVVAPLLGRLATPSALAIGAMAPDFPYFAGAPLARMTTHTFSSVLWFSLPVGAIAYLVFERWLRAPAVALLPRPIRLRVEPRVALAPPAAVAVSLVVGALTHVLWDAFTHRSIGVVAAVPPLRSLVAVVGNTISFGWLQYGSSSVGALALLLYAGRWLRERPLRAEVEGAGPGSVRARRRWARAAMLLLPPGFGLAVALLRGPVVNDWNTLIWFVAYGVVGGLSAAVALLAALGVWLRHPPDEAGAPGRAAVPPGATT